MLAPLHHIEYLLGRAFNDAPRQLKAKIDSAIVALGRRQTGARTCGEALAALRHAQTLVDEQQLAEWQAEMHAAWAVYFYFDCPNMEKDGRSDEAAMYFHIRQAQRLEPDNKLLAEIIGKIGKQAA